MYSMELFADYIDVESSIKKMNSVLDAIKEKISHEAYEYVMKAIVSGDAGRGDVIYQFITYGFTLGAKVVMAVQFQEVADMFTLVRSVQNEAYRYIEVLRFKEVIHKPPLLLSVIEPKHDIVAHLAHHFADRFNSEWFIPAAIAAFGIDGFLCKNNPHTRPFKHELSVNPGKYGPIGNISVPSTSATPATTAACAGPIRIAAVTGAINAKPIFTFHA